MPARLKSAGMANIGVSHVAKVVAQANCVFQSVDQQNDVGIDGYIELVTDEKASGCLLAVQIKSGASYCLGENWHIPADAGHIQYWKNHVLPVCGFVYDPDSDSARWVDISQLLEKQECVGGQKISVPAHNLFDLESFTKFSGHFLEHRERRSNDAYFGRTLDAFANTEDIISCDAALRALVTFHRNRIATWYYIIMALPSMKGHALIRRLVAHLSHIPGHPDIFWHEKNIINEETSRAGIDLLKRSIKRDSMVALLDAIPEGEGFGRGTLGQCVYSIIIKIPKAETMLESIVSDATLDQVLRYWGLLILIDLGQGTDRTSIIAFIERVQGTFTEDIQDMVVSWIEELRTNPHASLWW